MSTIQSSSSLYRLLYLPKLPIIFHCQVLLGPLAKLVVECDIFCFFLLRSFEDIYVAVGMSGLLASFNRFKEC